MSQRIKINEIEPDAYKAMFSLEKYLDKSALEPKIKELIKIRASQINGCSFCVKMHTSDALKLGEVKERIDSLVTWKQSDLFTSKEKAILSLTEEVTLIAGKEVQQDTYDEALNHFSENELAQAIIQIVTINAWNRIVITTKM